MNNKHTSTEDRKIALHYIQTFSDTTREPFLILDLKLKVIGANASFYNNFQVNKEETEGSFVYDLGNHQWDIPELKELLETILPKKKYFNDFEVSHKFPEIGLKIMLLNARQLDSSELILLAIEDVTLVRAIQAKLANYTKELEKGMKDKTEELRIRVEELKELNKITIGRELAMIELKEEIVDLKKSKDA
jgi:PAS domain-containing protein